MYRDKLQQLCDVQDIDPPNYRTLEDGPDHEKLFKGMVIVNGFTFYGEEYRRKKSKAGSEVDGMAYRLLGGNQEHLLYKNLLQQLVVANRLKYLVYTSSKTGPYHIRTHTAMVEVDGKTFSRRPTKTRRLAKLNAAGATYRALLPDMKFNHGL